MGERLVPPWPVSRSETLRKTEGAESEDEGGSGGNRKRQEQDEPSAFGLPPDATLSFICTFALICIQLKARHSNWCGASGLWLSGGVARARPSNIT